LRKMSSHLLLYSTNVIPDSGNDTNKQYQVVNANDSEALSKCPVSSFDEVKFTGSVPSEDMQAQILSLLKPLGKLVVDTIPDREVGQTLALDLKIQGYLDIMAAKDPSTGDRFVVGQKPAWNAGASAAVSIPVKTAETKKWKMDTDDLAEGDLIDENDLLDKDFKAPAPSSGACGDTVAGKRRACKDCTCGLAEQEAAGNATVNANATVEEKIVRSSACGNCSKGDAFRCAGCPFLGKPAFEAGTERVVLAMGGDDI
jgi:hypothetical protein